MMTLSKLAKLANVSVSTASKAFSGSHEVNAETREMIFEIAREYKCFKKFFNAQYPKLVVGVICPEFESLYYTRYLAFIQERLSEYNCEVCMASHRFSPEREKSLLEYYDQYAKVDGIIVVDSKLEWVGKLDVPTVFLSPEREQKGHLNIIRTVEEPLSMAVEYLRENRVDTIGFLGETLTKSSLKMFRHVMEKYGVPVDETYISVSEQRFEKGGYQAMEQLFQRGTIPRALFCAYDAMAIGAMKCIRDHGLSVPDDVAVIGKNDNPETRYLNPPLATISLNTEEGCRIAVELLIRKINGEEVPDTIQTQSELKLRESFVILDEK